MRPKTFRSHTTTTMITTAFRIDLMEPAIGMKLLTSQRRTPTTIRAIKICTKGVCTIPISLSPPCFRKQTSIRPFPSTVVEDRLRPLGHGGNDASPQGGGKSQTLGLIGHNLAADDIGLEANPQIDVLARQCRQVIIRSHFPPHFAWVSGTSTTSLP